MKSEVQSSKFKVEHRWILSAFLLLTFNFQLSTLFAQDPPKADPPKSLSSAKSADAPVLLDAEFTELYGDYALLRQEIERIETATGQVTIPQSLRDLGTRAQAKEKKMQTWVNAHHVGAGWVLNWPEMRFEAPAKEESAVSSQQSAEKPKQTAARSQKPGVGREK